MLYKNLTVKELYASIPDTRTIDHFFRKGLRQNNDRLAVSAMEELIVRGETEMILERLKWAFENGYVCNKTTMSTMIARSLSESCRGVDLTLHRLGKFIFKAKTDNPVAEMLEGERENGTKIYSGSNNYCFGAKKSER